MISADTLIHTLRGPIAAFKLAATGERVRCFSWDGRRIGVGELIVDPTPVLAFCHRVVFDNGASMVLTNTTQFLNRRGDGVGFSELVSALRQQDAVTKLAGVTSLSIMPFYAGVNCNGAPTYRQMREDYRLAPAAIDRRRLRPVARMVAEWHRGEHVPAGVYVRHIDGDVSNCEPENLKLEGAPKAKASRSKVIRIMEAVRMRAPNNHKIVGLDHWGDEEVYGVHMIGASNYAAGEVFLMAEDESSGA